MYIQHLCTSSQVTSVLNRCNQLLIGQVLTQWDFKAWRVTVLHQAHLTTQRMSAQNKSHEGSGDCGRLEWWEARVAVVVATPGSHLCAVGTDIKAVGDVDQPAFSELEVCRPKTGGAVHNVHQVAGCRAAA